ncbi:MAG: hypothetical protein PHH06_04280 [Candidatus Gracilibacteria bacterium]|nr:hypothetical protein [Candidatus Gracilibacteria bacterium]
MKTIKILLGLLTILVIVPVLGGNILSLTQNDITNHINKGYILSNSFKDYNECSKAIEKYNIDFPNYKRSNCFLNNNSYNYFICNSGLNCNIEESKVFTNSNNTNNTQLIQPTKVAYQDKLDNFLEKISSSRKEMSIYEYENLLNQLKKQLSDLGAKFKNNATIVGMVNYLQNGIEGLKKEYVESNEIEDFFCQLLGNCKNNNISTVSTNLTFTKPNDDNQGNTISYEGNKKCIDSYNRNIKFVPGAGETPYYSMFGGGYYGTGGDFRWKYENWAFVLTDESFNNGIKSARITIAGGAPNPEAPTANLGAEYLMELYECVNGEKVKVYSDKGVETSQLTFLYGKELIGNDITKEKALTELIRNNCRVGSGSNIRPCNENEKEAKVKSELLRLDRYYNLGLKPNTLYILEVKNNGSQYRLSGTGFNGFNKVTDYLSTNSNTANNEGNTSVINGACGKASSETYSTPPTKDLCNSGTPTIAIKNLSSYTRDCKGSNGGITMGCWAKADTTTNTTTDTKTYGSCNFTGTKELYYKYDNTCVAANFDCNASKLYWGLQFIQIPKPRTNNFYDTYGECTGEDDEKQFNVKQSKNTLNENGDQIELQVYGPVDDVMGCIAVLAHPNVPSAINPNACSDNNNYAYLKDYPNLWTYTNGGFIHIMKSDTTNYVNGVQIKVYFKNTKTGEIKSGNTISVIKTGTTSTTPVTTYGNSSNGTYGSCSFTGENYFYYKWNNTCINANFECSSGKLYWGQQFSPEPPKPTDNTLYNTSSECMGSITQKQLNVQQTKSTLKETGDSVVLRVSGPLDDIMGCQAVLAHPNMPSAINPNACSDNNNYVYLKNYPNVWNYTNGEFVHTMVSNTNVYVNGVQVRFYFKNTKTGEVKSGNTISVVK